LTISEYVAELRKNLVHGDATEHTHRPVLKSLLESLAKGIIATNEPKRIACGAPDFIITRKNVPLGHVETQATHDAFHLDFFGTIEMLLRACHGPYVTLVMSLSRYDFSVDYKDISERIALLTQEIRELQRMNEPHSTHDGNPRIDHASHQQRELRLRQIKEELSRMMPKTTQREH
jgi:hypothetical protein